MTDNTSQKRYSGVICRGSYALGTACGKCEKCRDQVDRQEAARPFDAAYNTPSLSLSKIRDLEVEVQKLQRDMAQARAEGRREALEQAAAAVDQRAASYDRDYGSYDYTTGVTEYPGNGDEWMQEWAEISEAIRALSDAPAPAGAQVEAFGGKACPVRNAPTRGAENRLSVDHEKQERAR